MDKAVLNRILDVYDAALTDLVYMKLYRQYKRTDQQMVALLKRLPPEEQDIVMDHIAATAYLHRRLLELACSAAQSDKL